MRPSSTMRVSPSVVFRVMAPVTVLRSEFRAGAELEEVTHLVACWVQYSGPYRLPSVTFCEPDHVADLGLCAAELWRLEDSATDVAAQMLTAKLHNDRADAIEARRAGRS